MKVANVIDLVKYQKKAAKKQAKLAKKERKMVKKQSKRFRKAADNVFRGLVNDNPSMVFELSCLLIAGKAIAALIRHRSNSSLF